MLPVRLSKRTIKFLKKMQPKHQNQVKVKIQTLRLDPEPNDARTLKGSENNNFWRADFGEYRIIYAVEDGTLMIYLIGKRNDAEVYRQFKQMMS